MLGDVFNSCFVANSAEPCAEDVLPGASEHDKQRTPQYQESYPDEVEKQPALKKAVQALLLAGSQGKHVWIGHNSRRGCRCLWMRTRLLMLRRRDGRHGRLCRGCRGCIDLLDMRVVGDGKGYPGERDETYDDQQREDHRCDCFPLLLCHRPNPSC